MTTMPDAADPQPLRFAVWHRPSRRRPWRRFALAATADEARRAMCDLMTTGPSGDWATGPADEPPKPPRLWPGARR
jgi:hypothetical protein